MPTYANKLTNEVTISGMVDGITRSDPDAGWAILRLKVDDEFAHYSCVGKSSKLCTLIGDMTKVQVGERLTVRGNVVNNAKWGPQVRVEDFKLLEPRDLTEKARYLAKNVHLIGPKFAKQIVDKFGDACFDVIDNSPERLLEIPGVGEKRVKEIKEIWDEQRAYRKFLMFATSIGLTSKFLDKIYRKYKHSAIEKIKEDPYRLARDIWGVGFSKADEVARHLGVQENSEVRLVGSLEYALTKMSEEGHCFAYAPELLEKALELLGPSQHLTVDAVKNALIGAVQRQLVVAEGNRIYLPALHRAECHVARKLKALLQYPMPENLRGDPLAALFHQACGTVSFELAEGQKQAVYTTLGSKVGVITGGPGCGKGLALDTPIPTPDGWAYMGNLGVGDNVFDENGDICRVTFVSEIHRRTCYRVSFDDGTSIVTDDQHKWLTSTRASRKSASRRRVRDVKPRGTDQSGKQISASVVTTPQIKATLRRSDGGLNHAIPVAGPLKTYHSELPIDPYVLGVYLGNGDTNGSAITNGCPWIRQEVERIGYVTSDRVSRETEYRFGLFDEDGDSILPILRGLDILGNKHIPTMYLFASEEDRMALLQGLMDTDGHCGKENGRCEITFTSERLASDTRQLLQGLGFKAHFDSRPAKIDGVEKGTAYRSTFTTNRPVFRMPRKLASLPEKVRPTTLNRYITAVDEVDSVPTVCIQVDSGSHLFLAGYACVPTHNTTITNVVVKGFQAAGQNVRLLAPTGRAAKRMSEVIGMSASTIHRLIFSLRKQLQSGLEHDQVQLGGVIVLDETSMVDIKLLSDLFDFVSDKAIVIFVGDKDQLPSVGAGAVLRDLIESNALPVSTLNQIFRQAKGSAISLAASEVNAGRVPALSYITNFDVNAIEKDVDFHTVLCDEAEQQANIAVWAATTLAQSRGFDPIRDCIVLAPTHKGFNGVAHLNALLQRTLNPTPPAWVDRGNNIVWAVGDRVMQTKNDYEIDAMNGEIGIIREIHTNENGKLTRMVVNYDGRDVTYSDGEQWSHVHLAYACTIHKLQGSEFPFVIMVLGMGHYTMLQRNLVYTGWTRGKKYVLSVAEYKALTKAIANNSVSKRNTWLAERLRG